MESILEIFAQLPVWITAITAVVTAATAITALTPTNVDNQILDAISKVLNFLAGNFGKNKNADADKTPTTPPTTPPA